MNPPRLQDWPSRLAAYIEARRVMPFAWGSQDCCQFARHGLLALTGEDPAAAWDLQPYQAARCGMAQLRRLGGVAALPALAGLPAIPLALAGRGDVVVSANGGRPALGLAVGQLAAFAAKHGLEFVPVASCAQAWRVG